MGEKKYKKGVQEIVKKYQWSSYRVFDFVEEMRKVWKDGTVDP